MTALHDRLIRYVDLVPCMNAFVDTKTPGSHMKENFTLIGRGVGENPNQHVHMTEKHGFNVSAARQPKGCLNSQHSHEHAEVFVVHSGRWRLLFGVEAGQDGHLDIGPGDVATVPPHMFRGFSKLDDGPGFLWVPLGQDDPGKVLWAPKVYELAKDYGLVLLKGGRLVDTTQGEQVPADAEVDHGPRNADIAHLKTPAADRMQRIAVMHDDLCSNPGSRLVAAGVEECLVIGGGDRGDEEGSAPIECWWPHGFVLRMLRMETGAEVPRHVREEAEVLFVQRGALEVTTSQGTVVMAAGDTFSTPSGLERSFKAVASDGCEVFILRGGETPAAPHFVA